MKFLILLSIVILSCCCSMSSADLAEDAADAAVETANLANVWRDRCGVFSNGCYAGCSWLNMCSIFKDHCKSRCGVKCDCYNGAANLKLTGMQYVFGVIALLFVLRTSL